MIRTRSVVLKNIKNVAYGKIVFKDGQYGSSITGIYGQNGSGKTAVVDAFSCACTLMRGQKLPPESVELVGPDSDEATIELEFEISKSTSESLGFTRDIGMEIADGMTFWAEYVFAFRKAGEGVALASESVSVKAEGLTRRTLVAYNREEGNAFRPQARWRALRALAGSEAGLDLAFAQRSEERASSSLVFAAALESFAVATRRAYKECSEGTGERKLSHAGQEAYEKTLRPLMDTVTLLRYYAINKLEVFDTTRGAALAFNTFALSAPTSSHTSWAAAGDAVSDGKSHMVDVFLPSDRTAVVPVSVYEELVSTTKVENVVLGSIVPGLSIEIHKLNNETMDNGAPGVRIEVLSCRGTTRIPFHCESEGIKKIVSMLGRLMDVYGDDSACIVIDEADSGVFEFLLGELLEVLADHGKGQLIFTAHNLRALECLPAGCLVFTTVNPRNRYIKFQGSGASNNLRNQYLRAINLGGQKEQVYEPTDELDMNAAFYQACNPQMAGFDELLSKIGASNG